MNRQTFDKRVAEIRQHVNWTKVAHSTGKHPNTVKYYLNGNGESVEMMDLIITHAEAQLRATRADLDRVINTKITNI